LQDLFNFVGSAFSLSTVLQIGHQIFDIIEYVHSCNFIHRDLKPANFLVGRNDRITEVQLIDFGLAKRYWSHKTLQHIPYRKKKSSGVIGSARYASINAHTGIELSRRDDVESITYMLIYFLRGDLPWQYLDPPPQTREQKNTLIGQMKSSCKFEQLCDGLPAMYASLLMMAQCLEFEESPNYRLIHNFMTVTTERAGVDCNGVFDWTEPLVEGAVVEHAEDTDRLSCNLSQGSLDSLDAAGRAGQTGTPSNRAGYGQAPQVGPLIRMAKGSSSDVGGGNRSSSLVRAMQSAGVTAEAIKKLGVSYTDTVKDNPKKHGESSDDEGAAQGTMDDLEDKPPSTEPTE